MEKLKKLFIRRIELLEINKRNFPKLEELTVFKGRFRHFYLIGGILTLDNLKTLALFRFCVFDDRSYNFDKMINLESLDLVIKFENEYHKNFYKEKENNNANSEKVYQSVVSKDSKVKFLRIRKECKIILSTHPYQPRF